MSAGDWVAIIFAQGEQTRWDEGLSARQKKLRDLPPSKHLIRVKGDFHLITRTVYQLLRVGVENIVVMGYPNLLDAVRPATMMAGEPGINLLHRVYDSRVMWRDNTLFLLGDVCFSHHAIKTMVNDPDNTSILMAGRTGANPLTGRSQGEMFGLYVDTTRVSPLTLAATVSNAKAIAEDDGRDPKLHDLWAEIKSSELDAALFDPDDYTDDIDTLEDYERHWPLMREAAIADDGATGFYSRPAL